jgi:predicted alpha-1,2-mannosidase
MDPLELINPLQGSDSTHAFSKGNAWPLVGVPRGMTYWTPQTSDGRFTFNRREVKMTGFRATHAPSPWMGDHGHFDVMPVHGPIGLTPAARGSGHNTDTQQSRPDRYATGLLRYGIDVELTATERCGVLRCVFPSDAADPAIVFQGGEGEFGSDAEFAIQSAATGVRLLGIARAHHNGVPDNFGCYLVAEVVGADVVSHGVFSPHGIGGDPSQISAPRAGAFLRLGGVTGPVSVRIATSFISHDQAWCNLRREVGGLPFEAVAERTAKHWRSWLSRIEPVGGSEDHLRRLYSAMYRVGLFPTRMHEPDEQNKPIHYSPYDGRVHAGVLYTNNGFWDTHRTVYPLLAMIDPEGFGEIVDGFLQAYRQCGWLPKWASPGHRNCMVGTHADSVIAEAVAHNIPGFDYQEAYAAIRRHAYDIGDPGGAFGRIGLEEFRRLGYVPSDIPYSVSRTLDFSYSDWCIAQVARRLGHQQDADELLRRSGNYRHLWHAGRRFMCARDRSGDWAEPWHEFNWGGPYIEGGPWQHSFNVPHDVQGLAELCGGTKALGDRLKQMFATPPRFNIGTYSGEIHEMTEMAMAKDAWGEHFGQYAHSNQPVHGVLWMLAELGEGAFAARQIRRVCESLYTPSDLPGDEDNGEMSAWYLFAAMGRLPLCPGSGRLVVCDPGLFESIRMPKSERVIDLSPVEPRMITTPFVGHELPVK